MKKLPRLISLILLSAWIMVHIGFVYAYYVITVEMYFDVQGVQFYRWEDGFQSNTMDFDYAIMRGAETVITNASWGIINDAEEPLQCQLTVQLANVTNPPLNFTLQVIDPLGEVKATWTTTTFPNDYAVLFTMDPDEIASINMEILVSEDADDFGITASMSIEG